MEWDMWGWIATWLTSRLNYGVVHYTRLSTPYPRRLPLRPMGSRLAWYVVTGLARSLIARYSVTGVERHCWKLVGFGLEESFSFPREDALALFVLLRAEPRALCEDEINQGVPATGEGSFIGRFASTVVLFGRAADDARSSYLARAGWRPGLSSTSSVLGWMGIPSLCLITHWPFFTGW
jgi:hypothetical protein